MVALVGAAFLPLALARGQVDDVSSDPSGQVDDVPSNPPGQEPREKQLELSGSPATVQEPEEGLHPASDESQPTTAEIVSVKVQTSECVDAQGSETRLGMMKNSAAYSHCP